MSVSGASYPMPRRNRRLSDASKPEAAADALRMQILRIEIESQTSGEGRCNNGERSS